MKIRRLDERKGAERKWKWKTFQKLKVTDMLNADIHSQLCLAGFRDSGLNGFANLCGHRIVVRIRRLRISMKAGKMNMAAWLSRSRCSATESKNATKQSWSRVEGFREIHYSPLPQRKHPRTTWSPQAHESLKSWKKGMAILIDSEFENFLISSSFHWNSLRLTLKAWR